MEGLSRDRATRGRQFVRLQRHQCASGAGGMERTGRDGGDRCGTCSVRGVRSERRSIEGAMRIARTLSRPRFGARECHPAGRCRVHPAGRARGVRAPAGVRGCHASGRDRQARGCPVGPQRGWRLCRSRHGADARNRERRRAGTDACRVRRRRSGGDRRAVGARDRAAVARPAAALARALGAFADISVRQGAVLGGCGCDYRPRVEPDRGICCVRGRRGTSDRYDRSGSADSARPPRTAGSRRRDRVASPTAHSR